MGSCTVRPPACTLKMADRLADGYIPPLGGKTLYRENDIPKVLENHSFFITSTPFFSSAAISSSRFAASSFVIGSLGPFDLRIFPLAKKADNIRSGKHPSISAPTNPPKDKPTICAFRICKASIKATRSSAWVNWKSSVCLDEMPYPHKSYRIAR